jgi:multisubunit Na+/H+ antiporter MnhE subunit
MRVPLGALVVYLPRFALSPSGDTRRVKHVVPWLTWWLALFWLWLLLAGEWNRQEWVAAAVAATIAATLAEFARTRTDFAAHLPRAVLSDLPQVLWMILVDFGIVARALLTSVVRLRVVQGQLVSRELERGAEAVRGVGPRAWIALAASYSPNAYVIDIDAEARTVLLHDLVPNRSSESPA